MKPMSLNLRDAKKISGDKHSSRFKLKSGHELHIVHSALPALQRKQLEKMPVQRFAEAGDVLPPELADLPQQDAPQLPGGGNAYAQAFGVPGAPSPDQPVDVPDDAQGAAYAQAYNAKLAQNSPPAAQDDSDDEDETSAQQAAPAQPPAAAMAQAGQAPPASPDFQKAYEQGQNAISEQQTINASEAKSKADIEAQNVLNARSLNQGFQQSFQEFQKQQKAFMYDYAANHINPKHYVENMSAPAKVSTAIGLLLGGFSTPFTHQGNPAMDFLNKQIDRDIAGQQSRIDQQKTLLGANQAMFHDKLLATNQTRVNLNDITDHQIQLAAAQMGTQQAKATADAAHFQLAQSSFQALQQNAMRTAVMQRLQQGGQGLNAIDLAKAGFIPPQAADKEQASIDAQKTAIAKTTELFNAMDKEQTIGNLVNPQSYQRVAALKAELVNAVMNASASKRLTRESVEQEIAPLEIGTFNTGQTRAAKEQGMMNIIQRHADPTPYMSHFAPASLPQYNQSPAQQTQTKGGVQYTQQVINGKAYMVPVK